MIVNTVLVLSAIVGNMIYVNYIPKTQSAEICLTTHKLDNNFECCEKMKIANINGSTMWYYQLDNKYISTTSYFMIKYEYSNRSIINSKLSILTQKNQSHCDFFNNFYTILVCFAFIYIMYTSIIYFLWKIYRFLQ
jgi:hypothetical protein